MAGAVAAAEAEHAPTPVQLLASVTGGAPAPTLSASLASLPVAGQGAAGGRALKHISVGDLHVAADFRV